MREPRPIIAVAAIAALLIGAQAPWWTVTLTGMAGTPGAGSVTGSAGSGGMAGVLPAVVLAALLATLMLGRGGTRAMAVASLLSGAGMVLLGLRPDAPAPDVTGESVQGAALATLTNPVATVWPIVYGVMGAAVAAASVLLIVRPPTGRTQVAEPTADVTDPLAAWKAMDAGEDPTRGAQEQPERRAPEEPEEGGRHDRSR